MSELVNQIPNTTSGNINVSELDDETNEKLKGDAIGDTSYSQSFVLKTLLKFSSSKWSEELEEDLCFLWDMTVEKDVCTYLFSVSYPCLVSSALEINKQPRFIEIVVGILANIFCVNCENKQITNEEIAAVLKELDSDDPLVLIQVMRFICAISYISSEMACIDTQKMHKIKFIMNNSVNKDLLEKTLEAVAKLTKDTKLTRNLVTFELYEATITAYSSIFNDSEDFSLYFKDKTLSCRYMLEIMCNICSYVDKFENYELLLQLQRDSNKYVSKVLKILHYLSIEENLLPVTDEIIFFMSVFRYTLTTLNINYNSSLFKVLCKIAVLLKNFQDEVSDMFDSITEMLCFLISRDVNQEFIHSLKSFSQNKLKFILQCIRDNQHKYDYKFDIPRFDT